MPARIDVLPRYRPALEHLSGRVLSPLPDPVLQGIVELIGDAFDAPISLVTLVLAHAELFRAQRGLPPELAAAGGIARDRAVSQLVVRDEALVAIDDARGAPEVPQALIDAYGLRAYVGAPVRLRGRVIGALCAFDTRARTFDGEQRRLLGRLAAQASARLDELAVDEELADAARGRTGLIPTYPELRTLLQPILGTFALFRISLAELGAVHRALHATGPAERLALEAHLAEAEAILVDARGALEDGDAAALALRRTVLALEQADVDASLVAPRDVIEAATTLARYRVRTIEDIRWEGAAGGCFLAVARPEAVRTLAGVLSALGAGLGMVEIVGAVRSSDHEVTLRVPAPAASPAWLRDMVAGIIEVCGASPGVQLRVDEGALVVALATAPER